MLWYVQRWDVDHCRDTYRTVIVLVLVLVMVMIGIRVAGGGLAVTVLRAVR